MPDVVEGVLQSRIRYLEEAVKVLCETAEHPWRGSIRTEVGSRVSCWCGQNTLEVTEVRVGSGERG